VVDHGRNGLGRFASGERRNHYGNILWTEEVIFKETRLLFRGNFAFLRELFHPPPSTARVFILSVSPLLTAYNRAIMKISRSFRGFRPVKTASVRAGTPFRA